MTTCTLRDRASRPRAPLAAWPALRVHECFEALADRQPSAAAIIGDGGAVTYAALERAANALAHALLAQGLEAEEAVGVLTGRSGSLPLAFLAILKAGGTYVPMAADLPAQRLATMATQAGMRQLIALDGIELPVELAAALVERGEGPAPAILRPEALGRDALAQGGHRPGRPGRPTDLVAILFTSGSTGQPKGVLLQHDACVNLAYGHIHAQSVGPDDRVLLASAPGFILGFRELCVPLLAGAAFVPAARALLDDPAALVAMMSRHRVSVAMFTPSYLRLLHGAVPAGLRCVLTAGERPNAEDARAYAQKIQYWNIQGATEVCGTICMMPVDPHGTGPLPSGLPFSNLAVYLLDDHGAEVPPGQVGRLHVVGVGVARGYLGQPEVTAEHFVATPFGRAFRSSDLARWNDDGLLESAGRADDLVKVAGQAVSLGEIEQTLLRHPAVRHAAAMQHAGRLVAFVACDPPDASSQDDWRRFLARTLPSYMLPAQVTSLARMPVSVHGKLDRAALLALASQSGLGVDRGALPDGELEQQVAEVWESCLGVRPVLRDDNFFALGGTSLLAIVTSQRLQALGFAVSAQTVLVATTVAALAEAIARAAGQEPAAPVVAAHQGAATLGQEEFWIAWTLGHATTGAQVTRILAVTGAAPAAEHWRRAWTQLVARHAALRTAFAADPDGKIVWHTVAAEALTPRVQLGFDRCGSADEARAVIAAHLDAPFCLTEPPLARAGLVQVTDGPGELVLWFAVHHAVADGQSARILQHELHALVLDHPLAPAPNGVVQASHAEQRYLASPLAEADRSYWRDQLDALIGQDGGAGVRELATDHRPPAVPSARPVAAIVERLEASTVAALTRLGQGHQVGLHALLVTLLAAEARRRDGRSSLIIGSGVSLRPPGADQAVGYFVNLLPLVLTARGSAPLSAQLGTTQATVTEALAHGRYPAGLLHREFRRRHPHARPLHRAQLFDLSLTANPSRCCGDARTDVALTPRRLPGQRVHPVTGLGLDFSYEPVEDGGLDLALVWNPDLHDRRTAQAWLSCFAAWARWLADDPGRAEAALPALLPEEASRLARWERGPDTPRPARRFHELFEAIADRHPQRAAVVTETSVQSLAELELEANRVAHALLAQRVAHEQPVAVLTDCSAALPAVVLGIWKAGAAYLPLALEQPTARLVHMVEESGASTLIVLDGHPVPDALAAAFGTVLRPLAWERGAAGPNGPAGRGVRPAIAGTPQDLAYIVYTSGSTGRPKGTLIQHDGLINAIASSEELFRLTPADRVALVATPGFDASLWELGMGLMLGLAIVPVSRDLRDDPWALKRWYTARGVTVAFHAPSYLRSSRETPFDGLRVLIIGGEAPSHDDVRCHANHVELWNCCGPTETCIFLMAGQVSADPDPDRPVPLGRPLPNSRVSIRRDDGERVLPGVIGEAWLSGPGLSRGYLNNPELTARRFVDTAEGRFYRSGDLGRWTEDGLVELVGRIDHQVKLHGQRLELGEIEQALCAHPAVAEAVTLVETAAGDTKAVRAFVRLRPSATLPTEHEWRSHLGERLPPYMIPASVTAVAAFRVTFEGKIDRDALLRAARAPAAGGVPRAPRGEPQGEPRGEIERRIAAVWTQLLGQGVSRDDNFFALGGNSLLAITMAHRLSGELSRPVPARELFAAPTLAGFARRLEQLQLTSAPAQGAGPRPPATSDLATEGQREFRIAEAAGLDTRVFTIPLVRSVEGEVPSLERWNTAWAALVARHEALRTYFHDDADGRLRRAAVPSLSVALEAATRPDRASARALARQRQDEPFVMGVPPLWRAGLIELAGTGEHVFWLALHHAVGDGRSLGILVDELGALLRGEALLPLAGSFAEAAAREQAYLAGPASAEDAAYWRDLLARQPDAAFDEGPIELPRSITASPGSHRFETQLDAATTGALRALARQHEASLHAVLLTVLALEARRRTGRADIVLGTAAGVRDTAAEAQVVGYYVNMVPVPCHLPQQVAFGDALRGTQQALAAGMHHARYPFARIYHDFWTARPEHHHAARYPIFDLAATENPGAALASPALRLVRMSLPESSAGAMSYELTGTSPGQDMALLHDDLANGGLGLQWQVNAALYTRETAGSWLQAVCGWAAWLAEDPARACGPWPGLLPGEAALVTRWEQGAIVPRPALRFHELFEQQLDGAADPGQGSRPAIVTQTATTTYAALEREANAIAHGLRLRGCAAGTVVGVLTRRSAHLAAAVLGIWKAGAIYVPLAADLPPERLVFLAQDAGVAQWIALDGLAVPPALAADLAAPLRPEALDDEFRRGHGHRPPPHACAGDAAYIIYTSGSTGMPKGTLIGHAAYVNSVLGVGETIGLSRDDRSLMLASPSFDVSLSELGLPLAFGAALCPVPHEILSSPSQLRAFLDELGVTVADISPSYLRLFDGAALPTLRILITGGEPPIPADVQIYAARHSYYNAYGPTENAITSTMKRLAPGSGGALSCGRPLANTCVQLCDPEGNRVPPGVVGELWLGGAGVAHGYVGRPDLTGAAFVDTAAGRRYRSGDLGRWTATGELELVGRIDDQVKISGIRIELGEIEHALASHPAVAQAVALVDGPPGRHQSLWAFVRLVAGAQAPTEDRWRDYLVTRLPPYMIPAAVIAVSGIPLAVSGKVDRSALRRVLAGGAPRTEAAPPEAGLEAEIAALWRDLLRCGAIARDDNFFALGGNSLLAIAVAHRLETARRHPVPARELFIAPTLRDFAHRVGQLGEAAAPCRVSSDRATDGQREFWVAAQAGLDTRAFHLAVTLVAGADAPAAEPWHRAWHALVARHDALRTSFYEDRDGVLRRSVVRELRADLEISTQDDLAGALRHVRLRQADPLVMDRAPLWRAGLVELTGTAGAARPVFWLALHHAVGDGVSIGVLTEELTRLLRGQALPPIAGQFDAVAGSEQRYLAGPGCLEDAQYWRSLLGGLGDGSPEPQPFDEWPLDVPRPPGRTTRNAQGAHHVRVRLEAATGFGLRDLAQRHGASLHAVMLAIMAHEVRRRTGRPAFVLGTAASTRDSASEARSVGYFVNLLPVACRDHGEASVEQAVQTMQRSLAEGLQHARYPFARMVHDFRRDHALSLHPARYPLFDLMVTEDPGLPDTRTSDERAFHLVAVQAPGDASHYELRATAPPQDMVLVHEGQADGGLTLHWYVNAAVYDRSTAEDWIDALAGWARFLASGTRLRGAPWPALLPAEIDRLTGWERGPTLPHPAASLAARVEQWARLHPDRPAVVTDHGVHSFAVLNARANALAHALLAHGVARGEAVGVLTERSVGLPEIVLAIWKAGGCYVPLVTDLPPDRLAFIARDAGIRLLVVLDGHDPPAALAAACPTRLRPETLSDAFYATHDQPPAPESGDGVRGADLACIQYTSGSTGAPKGVMLRHLGLNNLGVAIGAGLDIRSDDRALMMASPAFDLWISDLVMAWMAGAALVPLVRRELEDVAGVVRKIARLGVTVATMTPPYLRLFEQAELPGVRLLMTVGEPPHRGDALHYAARLRYMNGYGPTETTAAASFGQVAANAPRLTAGRPLANTQVLLRSSRGQPVAPGAVGLIWVGGLGLAAGYLNRPDLTARSFVETPAGRLYCTGDLGRWTRSGELEVLGRRDGQVKLRGQRVELGEIEHQLGAHPGVREAVAVVETRSDGTQILWAFVCLVPGAAQPTQGAWHRELSRSLPSYMLPAAVIGVAELPITTAGKVDRAALIRVASEHRAGAADADGDRARRTPPRVGTEQRIAEVWSEHLACPVIAREDSFFDLGGNSLQVIAVVNQLRRAFECEINDLYEHPRLEDFAGACRPLPGRLRALIRSAAQHWQGYRDDLAGYEAERDATLAAARQAYDARNRDFHQGGGGGRRPYRHVFLTGATGYLGSYVLRELLAEPDRQVSVLVRGGDDRVARARLGEALCHYFGPGAGAALRDDPRLTVLAGDLRRDDLGLSPRAHDQLTDHLQAVFHCAANVKHVGHSWEFHADNVAATERLLRLAGHRVASPADFHLASTLSVSGAAPEHGFRLFTEYDPAPDTLDANYYVRSKQQAERVVVQARHELANACIHRVGNVVFAADGGPLQRGIEDNAFFRQVAAFVRLGVVPDDPHLWLCHVDSVARGLVLLAGAADLGNATHHLEHSRRDTLADFVTAEGGARACRFDAFLARLDAAVDDPALDATLAETMENFGLYRGVSPQARARRLEVVSDRTRIVLAGLGLVWPPVVAAGRTAWLRQAVRWSQRPSPASASLGLAEPLRDGGSPCRSLHLPI